MAAKLAALMAVSSVDTMVSSKVGGRAGPMAVHLVALMVVQRDGLMVAM